MSDFCPNCKKLLKPGLEAHIGLCRKCREELNKQEAHCATR